MPNRAVRASATALPIAENELAQSLTGIQDELSDVVHLVKGARMATSALDEEHADPIRAILDIVFARLNDVNEALEIFEAATERETPDV